MGEDVSEFRQALGQFATGVAIISAPGPDGEPVGMTVRLIQFRVAAAAAGAV